MERKLKTPEVPPPAVMFFHSAIFRKFSSLAVACVALVFPACSEKSEAEKAEEERVLIREEKRQQAIQIYQTLAKEYPDDPKADEAKEKAAALQRAAPK